MDAQGMRPNSVTCSIILKSLAGHSAPQDIRRAMELIDRMSEDMDEVTTDCGMRTCETRNWRERIANVQHVRFVLFARLRTAQCISFGFEVSSLPFLRFPLDRSWDEVLFASVIEACVRIGQLDLLSQKLQQYASKGGLAGLTAPTYGSMIKAYGRARDIERVRELWGEMRRRNVRPTSITLGCMVDPTPATHSIRRTAP